MKNFNFFGSIQAATVKRCERKLKKLKAAASSDNDYDRQLLSLIIKRNNKELAICALSALLEKYLPEFLKAIAFKVNDDFLGEIYQDDIFQEVVIRIWSIKKEPIITSSVKAYLKTIFSNAASDWIKKHNDSGRTVRAFSFFTEEYNFLNEVIEYGVDHKVELESLVNIIKQEANLTSEEVNCILFRSTNLTPAQIAEEMDVTVKRIYKLLNRIKNKIGKNKESIIKRLGDGV